MTSKFSTVIDWIEAVVRAHPSRPVLFDDGQVWSYSELWLRSEGFALGLIEKGVRSGQSIGLIGKNQNLYVAAYLGVLRAGASVAMINPMLDGTTVCQDLDLVDAVGVLVGDVDRDVRDAISGQFKESAWSLQGFPTSSVGALPSLDSSDIGYILMTSGSTGRSKAALFTHEAMLYSALTMAITLPYSADDRSVAFLPFHAVIPEQIMPTLFTGGAIEVLRKFDVDAVADACSRGANTFDAVPTVMSRLIEHGDHNKLRNLRWVLFASEIMPPALLERWWTELSTVETHEFYGMTELLPLSYAPDRLLRKDPTAVGRPFPTSRMSINKVSGEKDSIGELLCYSPARMQKYLNNPTETSKALAPDGSIRTGDLGYIDHIGTVHLVGRLKNIIISGGINIAPAEIEIVAGQKKGVVSAVVVGVSDERWGETPIVVATTDHVNELSASELLDYCRSNLKSFKRPSGAAIVDEFPRTGIGKVDRAKLKSAIENGEIPLVRFE